MKTIFTLLFSIQIYFAIGQHLMINGVIDGPLTGGLPKAIEFYVIDDIADFSEYGFGNANNGGGSDGQEFTFPNIPVGAGEFIWVSLDISEFASFFGYEPDYTDFAANVNGNDAIELFHNGALIDVFGDVNTDGTGQGWEYTDGWAHSMGRVPGPEFDETEWEYSGVDALDGETTNATALIPYPEFTYTLDVVLTSLTVEKNLQQGVDIFWEVESVTGEEYFELSHSVDGQRFYLLRQFRIDGETTYHYSHHDPDGGTNYYRLSAIDADGLITYFPIRSVVCDKVKYMLDIAPNFVENCLSIQLGSNSDEGRIMILDIYGHLVYENKINANNPGSITVDVSGFMEGRYVVQYEGIHGRQIRGFIKL